MEMWNLKQTNCTMKDKLKMDKIFQKKLESFSEEPPAFLWGNIRAELAGQRRKKRVILFSRAAAAAVLLLAFAAGWYLYDTRSAENMQVAETETVKTKVLPETEKTEKTEPVAADLPETVETQAPGQFPADAIPAGIVSEKPEKSDELPVRIEKKVWPEYVDLTESPELKEIASLKPEFKKEEQIAETIQIAKKEAEVLPENWEKELIAENAHEHSVSAKKENTGWKLGMNVSPGYSSYSSKHEASYADNMTYAANDGNTNLSGGISVQYKTGKKVRLESGVYYAQNGRHSGFSSVLSAMKPEQEMVFASGNLYFNAPVNLEENELIMNSTAGVVEFEHLPHGAEVAAELETRMKSATPLLTEGELSQVFEFVEIPLYLRYLILDRKVGVELMGGVNAGVVVGNNAYFDNEYGMQNIGRTRDISKVNILSTIGVGVNYALNKNISIAVEPRLNYYLNSINQSHDVDFRPYRVGIYTGLYYEF